MAQITTGIRRLLANSGVYNFFLDLLGSSRAISELIDTFIRPKAKQKILDLGCGPAVILDHLPEKVIYVGIDISQSYIASAERKYGHRGLFLCAPLENISVGKLIGFDLVLGMGILHHLDDSHAEHFFAIAAAALNPRGRCLTVDSCRVKGQNPVSRLLIAMDRGKNVRSAEGYVGIARNVFPFVTYRITHNLLRLPYTHILMESKFGRDD